MQLFGLEKILGLKKNEALAFASQNHETVTALYIYKEHLQFRDFDLRMITLDYFLFLNLP